MAMTRIAQAALYVGFVTVLLLLVPGVAMQFTTEVDWGPGDFVAAAALIFGAGMAFVFGSRKARAVRQRAAVGLLVFGALAIVWAELAVGVFD